MNLLELSGVGLRYGDREALRGIDVSVRGGERVALVGPNGAGKSSLLRCITGLERSMSGDVRLDGVPISELGRERLARRIAVVPQAVTLPFTIRVEEVVALGRIPHQHPLRSPRPADHAAVARALERVGIGHLVGRDARHISLGERQLMLIAMALAQEPELLILDEPTVHLDLRHQVEVMGVLVDLNEREGTTLIAVLHDLGLAGHFFPRLILLDGGRVVVDGPPRMVLSPAQIRDTFRVDPRFVAATQLP